MPSRSGRHFFSSITGVIRATFDLIYSARLLPHHVEKAAHRISMSFFSVPIEHVPGSFVRDTPMTLPVLYRGEEVAVAHRRERSYHFVMFEGDLERGLTTGSLLTRARFIDESQAGELSTRRYIAVEIVREELFNVYQGK